MIKKGKLFAGTSWLVWVRNREGRLVRVGKMTTKLEMDQEGENSELRAVIKQQGEKIGQLISMVELLVRQLSGVHHQL